MKSTSFLNKGNVAKLAVIFVIIFIYLLLQNQYSNIRPEIVRDLIISFGVYGPLVFFLFAVIRPLILFPITIFYLASGLAFGPFWGGILATMGAAVSALIAHTVASKVGIDFLPNKIQAKIIVAEDKIHENGFQNMLMIRFIPLISFDMISYAGGLAKVERLPYLAGTVLGIAPRVFAYTYLGSSFVSFSDPGFWTAFALLLLMFIIPLGVYKKLSHQ
ncbi:MAG: TVP38/TMEM64 family protein [Tindallia sp. MSAO_Bac2]|nr:MAG: TVP38/TMEM64 family protein [Tindallia sp. MSAO_Bac2]